MNFHREIKKWVEQKELLIKLKRRSYFYFFKNNIKKTLFENILNNIYLKEKSTDETNIKKCNFLTNKNNNTHFPQNNWNPCNSSSFYENFHETNYQEINIYYLKSILLNLNNIHYLFYNNNDIYLKISQLFQEELQNLKPLCNLEQENKFIITNELYHENKILSSVSILNLVDVINLFNFYIYIEKYYFNFFYLILRTIKNFQDFSNVNDAVSIIFLKSCIKLKKEINKSLYTNKYKCYKEKKERKNYSILHNYFYPIKNGIFTKNTIHTLYYVEKEKYHTFPFFNNNKKKYMHFFFQKKKFYKDMTYSKFRKRKHKESMINCNCFLEKCIFLFLNKKMNINIILNYIKIIQNANIYNTNFISVIKDYLKKDYEYFTTEELIIIIKYLMKMKESSKVYKISFSYIKKEVCKNIKDYSIRDINKIYSIFSKSSHYDEKFLDITTNYIIENLNTVNSKTIVHIAINLHNLNYKSNKLFYEILNKYKPFIRNIRKKSNINNFFLKREKLIYKKKKNINAQKNKMRKRFNDCVNCDTSIPIFVENKKYIVENTYFRNFDHVKIKKLLLFIQILIENNIYIDKEWSQYFVSLIKNKFLFIKKKDFHILCFAMLHLESKEIFSSFFLSSSKYNIFKKCSIQKLISLNNLSSLIQITLLYSFHIYRYNRDLFLTLFFYILDEFHKMCTCENKKTQQEEKPHLSKEEKPFNIFYKNSKERILQNNEENIYVHDLKIYERNKNNKYWKKKEKKKSDELKNKINKIIIPSCDQIKDSISLQNLVQKENKLEEIFQNENTEHSPIEETNEIQRKINKNIKRNNDLQISSIYNKKNNITLTSNNSNINKEREFYENSKYENSSSSNFASYDNIIKKELELCYSENKNGRFIINSNNSFLCRNIYLMKKEKLNKEHKDELFFHMNDKNANSEKLLNNYTSDYFNKLRDSRYIIIIINNFFFNYVTTNKNWNINNKNYNFFQNINETYILNKLTSNQLSLVYKTYELCSSYINLSLKTIKIMNNNKNILSSKFHKQIISILRHDSKNEIISEYIQYPFQIDICIKRKLA